MDRKEGAGATLQSAGWDLTLRQRYRCRDRGSRLSRNGAIPDQPLRYFANLTARPSQRLEPEHKGKDLERLGRVAGGDCWRTAV